MSGAGRERGPKRPPTPAPGDAPWAKWRKPEAPVAVDAEKAPKTEPAVVGAKAKPTGTLGVARRVTNTVTSAAVPANAQNMPWKC